MDQPGCKEQDGSRTGQIRSTPQAEPRSANCLRRRESLIIISNNCELDQTAAAAESSSNPDYLIADVTSTSPSRSMRHGIAI
jgi:hypothetical protein